ncbi:MAG: 4-phosphoerythronate dehydrogenase PdxB [Candidatus Hydrogenedens sp.]|nr:4-phosphoerythronate dehydrogenase PdxB [Candidatus Hydrogenedens sp.]
MLIIADENIPYVKEGFNQFGEVITVHGRKITKDIIKNADILLVRSITKVNADLLEGSSIRFIGTATIGYDHIDLDYINSKGIAFSSAPGSNANSVAEYVVSGLLQLEQNHGYKLQGKKIGIVGVGNVGSRVAKKVPALGLFPVLYDPPLAEKMNNYPLFEALETILNCDIITFHVPLEKKSPYPTFHMADKDFFAKIQKGTVIINTSRGAVIETESLLNAIEQGIISHSIIDVWENEPNININLLKKVTIGTPHIAGYSFDGKVNGTYQLYLALCNFLKEKPTWDYRKNLPDPPIKEIHITDNNPLILHSIVHKIYNITADDKALREIENKEESERGSYFDLLRKNYPIRREFHNTTIRFNKDNPILANQFERLGFKIIKDCK